MHEIRGYCRPAVQCLAERCAKYPSARAAALCGIPEDQIHETAHRLDGSGPVSFFHWAGVCQQADATQTGRAIGLLYTLTGAFGVRGGNRRFAAPPLNDIMGLDLLPPDQLGKTLGQAERPLGPPARGWLTSGDFAQAVLESAPYPVRGLLSFGANPRLTKPELAERGRMALPASSGSGCFTTSTSCRCPQSRRPLPIRADRDRPRSAGTSCPGRCSGFAGRHWLPG